MKPACLFVVNGTAQLCVFLLNIHPHLVLKRPPYKNVAVKKCSLSSLQFSETQVDTTHRARRHHTALNVTRYMTALISVPLSSLCFHPTVYNLCTKSSHVTTVMQRGMTTLRDLQSFMECKGDTLYYIVLLYTITVSHRLSHFFFFLYFVHTVLMSVI